MWIKRNDREKMNEGNILFPPHHYYLSLFISSNINLLHFRNITIFYFPPLHFVTLDTVTFKNPNFLILLPFKNSSKLPLAFCCCSVAQSCLTLQSHGLQHSSLPCPSLPLKVCWNSCPLNRWCHPTISSSVVPFSSCPQPSPASVSFRMSRLFTSGGQSTGDSFSVLPMNTQDWFPSAISNFKKVFN